MWHSAPTATGSGRRPLTRCRLSVLQQLAAQAGAHKWMDRLSAPTLEDTSRTLLRLWQQELGMCVLQANAHLLLSKVRQAFDANLQRRCHQSRLQSGRDQKAEAQRSRAGLTSRTGTVTTSRGSYCAIVPGDPLSGLPRLAAQAPVDGPSQTADPPQPPASRTGDPPHRPLHRRADTRASPVLTPGHTISTETYGANW